MAISSNFVYRGYVARFDGNTVNNLGDVSPSANAEQVMLTALGDRGPGFVATEKVAPTIRLSTRDAASILSLANPFSANDGLSVNTLATIQFQKKGATTGIAATSPRGFLLVNDFGCNERDAQALVVNATYHALSDGTNAPLTFNTVGSLTGSPAAATAFRLGPVVWQGSVMKGITNARVQTGLKTSLPPFSGVYPEDLTVDEFNFTGELSGTQLEITDGSVIGAEYPITSPIDIYFQALPNGGIPTDYGSAVHIRVRFTDGCVRFDNVASKGTGNSTMSLVIQSLNRSTGASLKPTLTMNTTISLP